MHAFLTLLLAAFTPTPAHALELSSNWYAGICSLMPCIGEGGITGLNAYLFSRIVTAMQAGFVAVALLMVFIYASTMVINSHDENAVKESRVAYLYAIIGCVFASLASLIASAVSPTQVTSGIVNVEPIEAGIGNIILYIKLLLAVALTVNIVYQGFRLINARGEQDQMEKARKRLIAGFIGTGIVLMASAIVTAVNPGEGANSAILVDEIIGVANFFVTLFGVGAVIVIILAGMFLIVSVQEDLKEKAKSMIKTSIIALIIILFSYAIISLFLLLG